MPLINVEMFKGRTLEQRRKFIEEVTNSAVNCLGAKPENVRIRITELEKNNLARGGRFVESEQRPV